MGEKSSDLPVSMKDVAKACGLSVVTVSRALKGDRNHSAETRERVLKMAEQLGYRINPLVAALMSARGRHKPAKGTVNLALIDPGGDWPGHPFYEGAVSQAAALGYSIEMFKLAKGANGGRLRKILQARGVRGVIVLPAPEPQRRLEIDLGEFAAVTIGYSVIAPDMPRVVTDTYGRFMEALTKAGERGYRRIGVVSTEDLDRRFQHLNTAATLVYRSLCKGDTEVVCLAVDHEASDQANAKEVCRWARRESVDAILSQAGLCHELLLRGLKIPEEVGYVHLHLSADPQITCMDQNQDWIGRKATDVVVGMINRNEFRIPAQSQTIMIPSVWRAGTTLPVRAR